MHEDKWEAHELFTVVSKNIKNYPVIKYYESVRAKRPNIVMFEVFFLFFNSL